MDTKKQRKLEQLRRLPIVGGLAILLVGNAILLTAGVSNEAILIVIICLTIGMGGFLSAMGLVSIRMRRWVFSVEDRIKRLEDVSQNRHIDG